MDANAGRQSFDLKTRIGRRNVWRGFKHMLGTITYKGAIRKWLRWDVRLMFVDTFERGCDE